MASSWYAVRCVFRAAWHGVDGEVAPRESLYEERITLWQADSAEEAIALAEGEAAEYSEDDDEYLELAQAYELFDELGHGAEVFSLMRSSHLEPDAYLDAFFDTGKERAQAD
jgi:hypothetical protein